MAIGITKYVGAGSRPMKKVTEGDATFDPTEGSTINVVDNSNSGGSTSGYYSYKSALEKIAADQAAAQAATTRATTGAQNQANYLTGLMNQGVPTNVSNLIDTSGTQGREYIQSQYDALMNQLRGSYTPETNVGTGYLGAQGRTTAGYNALQNYLQANPPTAFQQAPQVPQTMVSNDLAQYMGGQGVSTAPVDPTIAALNAAAGGGAQNYNRLLSTRGQLEQAGQQSRLAEQQMGRSGALSGLEQLYQGQTGGLQQQQLQALAELQSNLAGQKLTAEQQAASRNQAIQDALASLLGTGYITPESINPVTVPTTAPVVQQPAQPAQSAPVAKLAAQVANATNKTLVNRANAFIAANPTATPAQVAKEFPSLAAAAKKKKK
jgi:hypothetical protein